MARQAEIIAQATDYAGNGWDVRERRPTAHGFDVLIGWPHGEARGRGGRGVAVILTAELARYLSATRQRDIDLPIGLTASKRLRGALGVSWSWDDWWAAEARGSAVNDTGGVLPAARLQHGSSQPAPRRDAVCY